MGRNGKQQRPLYRTLTLISDPENPDFCEECPHSLDIHCDRCDSLDSNFRDILKRIDDLVINDETRTRINLENKECSRALHAWKAHLLLSVNQEEAKQNALTQLDEETCLIIMDWAMKYLPQHYREQMSEFFGKRGRSWHIRAVITRSQDEGRCEVECTVNKKICFSPKVSIQPCRPKSDSALLGAI